MPLVVGEGGEQEAFDEAHEQARKIQPRYAKGELIKGVLLEQGIPSLIRRTAGFDVPDFLAAGPRDVLVPEAGVAEARSLLADVDADHAALGTLPPGWEEQALAEGGEATGEAPIYGAEPRPWELRLAATILIALLAFGAIAGIVYALVLR